MENFLRSWERFTERYRKVFSIEEIERETIVKWMFGAMLFFFFPTFYFWTGKYNITQEAAEIGAVCWPYFKNCGDLYFLQALPFGYSQSTFYMLLYAVMLLIVYYMWKERWVFAHMWLTLLFLFKTIAIFVLSYNIEGPYDYYHLFLTAALLFIPYKEYFLKVIFVFLYFVSVTVKFTPAWIVGTYFSSMETGLPLMPDWTIPLVTNFVIFAQVIECWFLLSRNWLLQRIALVWSLFFHWYSGILVLYHYPSITLPPILILFGPMYRHTPTPFTKKAIAGWVLVALIGLFQVLGFAIPTNRYLTLEGNRFGMFMFEANHQCVATITKHFSAGANVSKDNDFESAAGTACGGFYCLVKRATTIDESSATQVTRYESGTAWNRCDPYEWWSRLHHQCDSDPSLQRIAFRFDHSINGDPFYRIIDTGDICELDYKPFTHNEWIRLPPEAPVVGYPVQNWYHN